MVYVATAFLTATVYIVRAEIIAKRIHSQTVQAVLLQGARRLEQITGRSAAILDAAKSNPQIQEIAGRDYGDGDLGHELDDYFQLRRIRRTLSALTGDYALRFYADSNAIYTRQQLHFFSSRDLESAHPEIARDPLVARARWFISDASDEDVIVTVAPLLALERPDPFLGYLTVEYPIPRIVSLLKEIEQAIGGHAAVVADDGHVIATSDIDRGEEELMQEHSVALRNPPWRFRHLGLPPRNALTQREVLVPLLIMWVATAAVFLVLARVLSANLTNRIDRIDESMRAVQAGLQPAVPSGDEQDEIAKLHTTFLDLLRTKQNLTDLLAAERLRIQRAELDVLEASISPHFLYNTLDAVVWEAKSADAPQVARMVSLVAAFYRKSHASTGHLVSLSEELDRVRLYVEIERMRTDVSIGFETCVDESVLDFTVPRMLLQPLVENSLEHGIRANTDGVGVVRVYGYTQDESVVVAVQDDGQGVDESTLARLRSGQLVSRRGGYGLANIRERLRLLYGDAASLAFQLIPQAGLRVEITIPRSVDPRIVHMDR